MSKTKKKDKKSISGKKLFKGLLVGSFIGATTAFFITPYSGKELRRTIKQKTRSNIQLVKDVKESAEDVKLDTRILKETTEELVPEFVNGTKKSIRAFQFKATPRIADIKRQLEKIKLDLDEFSDS